MRKNKYRKKKKRGIRQKRHEDANSNKNCKKKHTLAHHEYARSTKRERTALDCRLKKRKGKVRGQLVGQKN